MPLAEAKVVACAAMWFIVMLGVAGQARSRGLRIGRSLLLAGALFLADPVSLGLGLLVLSGLAPALAIAGAFWLRAVVRGDVTARQAGALRCAAFAATLGFGYGCVLSNFQLAEQRAGRVIEAVQAYAAEQGALPPGLEALAPRYLSSVPAPRMLTLSQSFLYDAQRAELSYLIGPLMGRVYDVRDGTARPLD